MCQSGWSGLCEESGEWREDFRQGFSGQSKKKKLRLRPSHLAVMFCFGVAVLLVLFFTNEDLRGIAGARALSGIFLLVMGMFIFIFLWMVGAIRHVLRNRKGSGVVLLSPEVVAVVMGTFISLGLGSFAVNNLMEISSDRQTYDRMRFERYQRKIDLVERFGDKGQQLMYYALMYRNAEEWWMDFDRRRGRALAADPGLNAERQKADFYPQTLPFLLDYDREFSTYTWPGWSGTLQPYGELIAEVEGDDREEVVVGYYHRYVGLFIEAGSMDAMCKAIGAYFSTPATKSDEEALKKVRYAIHTVEGLPEAYVVVDADEKAEQDEQDEQDEQADPAKQDEAEDDEVRVRSIDRLQNEFNQRFTVFLTPVNRRPRDNTPDGEPLTQEYAEIRRDLLKEFEQLQTDYDHLLLMMYADLKRPEHVLDDGPLGYPNW